MTKKKLKYDPVVKETDNLLDEYFALLENINHIREIGNISDLEKSFDKVTEEANSIDSKFILLDKETFIRSQRDTIKSIKIYESIIKKFLGMLQELSKQIDLRGDRYNFFYKYIYTVIETAIEMAAESPDLAVEFLKNRIDAKEATGGKYLYENNREEQIRKAFENILSD